MAIVISGAGTITGIAEGGLPDGSVAAADIKDGAVTAAKLASTLDLSGKTVTLPAGVGGKVLQVVSTTKTSTQSTTSNTWVDITSLSLNITPSSTSSKIYISTNITASCGGSGINNGLRLLRDATELSLSTQSSSALGFIRDVENSGNATRDLMFHILDTPSTTSQITYKWQFQTSSGYTYYIGAPQNDTTNFNLYLTMVAMEIAG